MACISVNERVKIGIALQAVVQELIHHRVAVHPMLIQPFPHPAIPEQSITIEPQPAMMAVLSK